MIYHFYTFDVTKRYVEAIARFGVDMKLVICNYSSTKDPVIIILCWEGEIADFNYS